MERKELSEAIGSRIKFHRVQKHLSQEQMAFRAGMHPSYYGCIERGEKCPTIDTLYRISLALEVPLSDLINAVPAAAEPDTDPVRRGLEYRASAALRLIPMKYLMGTVMIIELLTHMLTGKELPKQKDQDS